MWHKDCFIKPPPENELAADIWLAVPKMHTKMPLKGKVFKVEPQTHRNGARQLEDDRTTSGVMKCRKKGLFRNCNAKRFVINEILEKKETNKGICLDKDNLAAMGDY